MGFRPAMDKMIEEGNPPTFFEALTAIALNKFAEMDLDIVVIEAGMGGATDATNVFESRNLCAAVLTPIAMEHSQLLGEMDFLFLGQGRSSCEVAHYYHITGLDSIVWRQVTHWGRLLSPRQE